jgi:aryl-alcohol dehydrogenase-like predicted oxidoreductase
VLTGKYIGQFPKGTRLGMQGLEWLKERSLSVERLEKVRALNDIALDLGTTLPKLAIAWCAKNPNVSTIILGASQLKHLEETLTSLEVIPLISSEIDDKIEAVLKNKPEHPMF